VLFSPKCLLSLSLMENVTTHFLPKISTYVSPPNLRIDKTVSRYTYKRQPHE
jgi:hypothetical protein